MMMSAVRKSPNTILLLLILSGIIGQLEAHEDAIHQQDDVAEVADFTFDDADQTVPAEVLVGPMAYDADVLVRGDRLWYAWLEFVPNKGDVIWVGCRHDGQWEWRRQLEIEPGEYAAPTLTGDHAGRVWLSYEVRSRDQWDVRLSRLDEKGQTNGALRVSPSEGAGHSSPHRSVVGRVMDRLAK